MIINRFLPNRQLLPVPLLKSYWFPTPHYPAGAHASYGMRMEQTWTHSRPVHLSWTLTFSGPHEDRRLHKPPLSCPAQCKQNPLLGQPHHFSQLKKTNKKTDKAFKKIQFNKKFEPSYKASCHLKASCYPHEVHCCPAHHHQQS